MKKVAIVTITNSGMNCGNRLQNYAMHHALERYSTHVETIVSAKSIKKSLLLSKVRRLLKILLKSDIRRRYFDAFEKRHIKKSKTIRYEGVNDHVFNEMFDIFIAGSDQVWNPHFHFNSAFEFLVFADEKKRFSYSASFGVDAIAQQHRSDYSKWLKQMKGISVREEAGQNLVKQLSGRDAKIHVDPTMLLDASLYRAMEEKPKQPLPDKYLMTYFFGRQEDDQKDFIKDLAEYKELNVLEVRDDKGSLFYDTGPQHFLYIISHADYICTDSFHVAVFSILFSKPFTVFYRRDADAPMDSRIDTLLHTFKLGSRLFGKLSVKESARNIMPYDEVSRCLSREREAAHNYLRDIFG